jgi:RNA polymerase sigma-70 factor (ECF subfamily)
MDALYRSALKLTKNSVDAEDLVQETFIKAYRFWDKFEPGSNCRAWLFKIMTNVFINQYRSRSRSPVAASSDELDDRFLYSGDLALEQMSDPEREFSTHVLEQDVHRAIDNLPDDFKVVVVLSFLEQFSYKEIAKITGLHLGTVKSRLHRGRKLLQKRLIKYAYEYGYMTQLAAS